MLKQAVAYPYTKFALRCFACSKDKILWSRNYSFETVRDRSSYD